MRDDAGRNIDYLRISVTDRCNLRCSYCMPDEGVEEPPYRLLSGPDILKVVRTVRAMGVTHVRLTGGEPLVRPDVADIIRGVRDAGVADISLTTNGILLADCARNLKEAGLKRVNVSLDSLDPAVFRKITRTGNVGDVLAGIDAALAEGLNPVKINVVVMAGINEDGILDLARLSMKLPVSVRFIEVMPIGPDAGANSLAVVPADEVKERVSRLGTLETAPPVEGAGPARTYRLRGAPGTVGFIAPLSHPFCAECNRLRLTPDGKLRPCLASDTEVDLLPALRSDDPEGELSAAVRQALLLKPRGHDLFGRRAHFRRMCQIGG